METIERLITGSKTNFSTKVENEIIGNDSLVLSLPTIEGRERRLTKNDKIGIVIGSLLVIGLVTALIVTKK